MADAKIAVAWSISPQSPPVALTVHAGWISNSNSGHRDKGDDPSRENLKSITGMANKAARQNAAYPTPIERAIAVGAPGPLHAANSVADAATTPTKTVWANVRKR